MNLDKFEMRRDLILYNEPEQGEFEPSLKAKLLCVIKKNLESANYFLGGLRLPINGGHTLYLEVEDIYGTISTRKWKFFEKTVKSHIGHRYLIRFQDKKVEISEEEGKSIMGNYKKIQENRLQEILNNLCNG